MIVRRALAAGLIVALLAASLPALGLHGTTPAQVVACGHVVNENGWPLPDVMVRAVGRGFQSIDHGHIPGDNPVATRTGPDGSFFLDLQPDRYNLLVLDDQPRSKRAGAVYAPTELDVAAHLDEPGTCGAERGKPLDDVVLLAPGTGFQETFVSDGAGGGTPLSGATAATRVLGLDWGQSETGAGGVARLTCPLGIEVQVTAAKPNHDNVTSAPRICEKTNPALSLVMWRTPVQVLGALSDAQTNEAVADAAISAEPQSLPDPSLGHPYVFQDETDATGAYALALPWGDSFLVKAVKPGYEDRAHEVAIDEGDESRTRDFVLERDRFTVLDHVTDFRLDPITGASVEFTGPSPSDQTATATSGPDGAFSIELHQGAYQVEVQAGGKTTRACTVVLALDGTHTVTPEACFQLLEAGHGGLTLRVLDQFLDEGVPGVDAAIDSVSGTTDTQGRLAIEVPAGTHTLTLSHADYVTRELNAVEIGNDQVIDLGDAVLQRAKIPLQVAASDDSDAGEISGADVCVRLIDDSGGPVGPETCKTADAGGELDFDLEWTTRGGAFDAGNYRLRGSRLDDVPLYDDRICVASLELDADAVGATATCALSRVPGTPTPVGPVTDAHTGLPVQGARVTASSNQAACGPPDYTCDVLTDLDGRANLVLPEGHSFTVSLSHDDYQDPPEETTAVGASSFDGTALARVPSTVDLRLLDAHTLGPVDGAPAAADAPEGFVCDPGFGGFDCAATTDADGEARLLLPWGAFSLTAQEGAYDVDLTASFMPETERGVRFQKATRAISLAPGDAPGSLDLRALRAADEPIEGTVLDFQGVSVADAALHVSTHRHDAFECDPAQHDTPDADPVSCASRSVASGQYVLALPHGTLPEHTWSIRVESAGHFDETADEVPAGSGRNFTLWPLRFTLVVEARDAVTQELLANTAVCYRNLDAAIQDLPSLPVTEECKNTGRDAAPAVFEDIAWHRDSDETDNLFLVRATPIDHAPTAEAGRLGPANARVVLLHAPLNPDLDIEDTDGDLFPNDVESALDADPEDGASHPLNDGALRNDLNDGHSVFIESLGADGPADDAAVAVPADGSYRFAFRGERYPGHFIGASENVPAGPGTRVAFALFDVSLATRIAARIIAGEEIPQLRDEALFFASGQVGDATFLPGDEDVVQVDVPADALPLPLHHVVPWAWIRADDAQDTPAGSMQPTHGYHSVLRNLLHGSAAADKLDYHFTPILLLAASHECELLQIGIESVRNECTATTPAGSVKAEANLFVNIAQGRAGVEVATEDTATGGVIGDRTVKVEGTFTNPSSYLPSLEDTDGDGTATLDELGEGRDPTQAEEDTGFPQEQANRTIDYAHGQIDVLRAWLEG